MMAIHNELEQYAELQEAADDAVVASIDEPRGQKPVAIQKSSSRIVSTTDIDIG